MRNKLNPLVYIESNSLLAHDIQSSLNIMSKMVNTISVQSEKITSSLLAMLDDAHKQLKDYIASGNDKEKKTVLINKLNQIADKLGKDSDCANVRKLTSELKQHINLSGTIYRYIKNYEGTLFRKNRTISKYRFYDEREWRFIPKESDKRVKISLTKEEFLTYRSSRKQKPFIAGIDLPFSAEDITTCIAISKSATSCLISSDFMSINFKAVCCLISLRFFGSSLTLAGNRPLYAAKIGKGL